MSLVRFLKKYKACGFSLDWAKRKTVGKDAWEECPRPDWMLWIAVQIGVNPRPIMLAVCDCIRVKLDKKESPELDKMVKSLEKWGAGKKIRARDLEDKAYDFINRPRKASTSEYDVAWAIYTAVRIPIFENDDDLISMGTAVADVFIDLTHGREERDRDVIFAEYADVVRKRIQWEMIDAAIAAEQTRRDK